VISLINSGMLATASREDATVTVLLGDGQALTGSVKPHATEPDVWVLLEIFSSTPRLFDVADVDEVFYE